MTKKETNPIHKVQFGKLYDVRNKRSLIVRAVGDGIAWIYGALGQVDTNKEASEINRYDKLLVTDITPDIFYLPIYLPMMHEDITGTGEENTLIGGFRTYEVSSLTVDYVFFKKEGDIEVEFFDLLTK